MAVKGKQDKADVKDNSLRNRRIWMGAAAITVLVLALFFLFNRQDTPVASQEPDVGVMDMGEVIRAHKDYGKLQTLMREVAALEAELKLKGFEMTAQAAKADKKLFDDAARQKANLEIITRHSETMEELKVRADNIYRRMKPQFDKERDAIDQEYGNRILNIQLKADNAVTLELSEAERSSLQAEWNRLKDERNEKHNKLLADQQRRYDEAVEAETGEIRRAMLAERDSIAGKSQADELQHFKDVQDRNAQAIDDAMKPIQLKMDMAKKKTALELKLTEMKLLEQKIFDDICGRAAKLAIIHHLNLIIADPIDNILGEEYNSFGLGDWHELKSPVIGINTLDLTQEMLQEMKNIQ
ncbi:MAG: hypothetical protein J6N55_02170 [Anaerovibrio sp.]|uniref:hypothetical protein n=1 Tax=Anaerovibrio sp. TaxID=1872532 RepID=UPI001B216962|nr:hypothetical protein [Anaerovibrio sp.]MBO6245070.1 hypothetical protein [Anaerovibrio sp.]